MFDSIHDFETFSLTRAISPDPLCVFVQDHRDALFDAAALLAGRRGVRVAQSVLDGLAQARAPSRRIMNHVGGLLDILMLEHVHDMSREEAARFAEIDPAGPRLEEICLLADGLRSAIDASNTTPGGTGVSRTSGRAAA